MLASTPRAPVSPTGIKDFMLCPRKWAWRKIGGIQTPPHRSAALGTAVHAQLERWFKDHVRPDATTEAGRIAEAGLHHWPPPQLVPKGLIEVEIFVKAGEATFHGFKDLGYPDPRDGVRVVGDHKTTSDFKWALTVEDLLDDVQGAIYAAAEMVDHDVSVVRLRWVYYRTKGALKTELREVEVTREHVEKVFQRKILPVWQEMQEILDQGLQPLEVRPNPLACAAFGGCPHVDRCNITPIERLKAQMGQDTLATLLAQKQHGTGVAGLPVIGGLNAPEGPRPPQVQAHVVTGLPTPTLPVIQAPPPPVPVIQAPPVPVALPTPPAPAPSGLLAALQKPAGSPGTLPPVLAAPAAPAAPPAPVPVAPPAPAPTADPLAALLAPPPAVPVPTPFEHAVQTVAAQIESPAASPIPTKGSGMSADHLRKLWLLIDTSHPTYDLDAGRIATLAHERVVTLTGLPDYKLVDFGKGAGYLRVAFRDVLLEILESYSAAAIFVDTSDERVRECLPVLLEYGYQITRPLR